MKKFLRTRIGLIFWTLAMLFGGYGLATINHMRFVVVTVEPTAADLNMDSQQDDDSPNLKWSKV